MARHALRLEDWQMQKDVNNIFVNLCRDAEHYFKMTKDSKLYTFLELLYDEHSEVIEDIIENNLTRFHIF